MTMTWNLSMVDAPVPVPVLGAPDPETGIAPILGYEAGYHVNLPEALMTEALEPYRVTPEAPARVLAGVETAFLRFDDEAAALAAVGAVLPTAVVSG